MAARTACFRSRATSACPLKGSYIAVQSGSPPTMDPKKGIGEKPVRGIWRRRQMGIQSALFMRVAAGLLAEVLTWRPMLLAR
jgi:hypothetical protein